MMERAGRPRDPEVDRRITDAAMDVFGSAGWAGFSIDAVARVAGVGKASIYLRWASKEELLTDSVGQRFAPIVEIDTGNVREDLLAMTSVLVELFSGRHGLAARRMTVESHATEGIAERWQSVRGSQITAARTIVQRGVRRGELRSDTPVTILLDTLCGAAINHAIATPPHLRERVARERDKYTSDLVDFVLASLITTDDS